MNLQIAQVYLQHGDPALATRTWQQVMEQIVATKLGVTQSRWHSAIHHPEVAHRHPAGQRQLFIGS